MFYCIYIYIYYIVTIPICVYIFLVALDLTLLIQSHALRKGLDAVWQPEAVPVDGYCATSRGLSSFPAKLLPEKVLPSDTEAVVVKPMPGGSAKAI